MVSKSNTTEVISKTTKPIKAKKTDSIHYIDNKVFYAAMIEHTELVKQAKAKNLKVPPISDYIGDCLMKIADRLSHTFNFVNYPFREEMIADGIENCLLYVNNFNPEKSNNPFAYFTQISYFAFIRRIQREKKHLYTKYKMAQQNMYLDLPVAEGGMAIPQQYGSEYSHEHMVDFMEAFEKHKREKKSKIKQKKKKPTLDGFVSE